MAKLFRRLKSIFVVEKRSSESSPSADLDTSANTNTDLQERFDLDELTAEVKPEYLDILFEAMEENNFEGYDYLEFRESILSLKDLEMDDNTKLKSAVAMAKSLGADLPKLISTAKEYLQILSKEEKKFASVLQRQVQERIIGNEHSIDDLKALIASRQDEIERIHLEIKNLELRMQEKKEQLRDAATKLETVNISFRKTYDYLANALRKDISDLEKLE